MPETQVKNKKAEMLPDEQSYNDKDKLNDMLMSLKHLTYMYSLAMQEASNPALYKVMSSLFEKSSQMQRNAYYLMFEKGWYTLEKQTPTKIQTIYDQYSALTDQL